MTFTRKFNGKTERPAHADPIVACYTCPEHGEFDAVVQRDESGEAPDVVPCPMVVRERERWDEGRYEGEDVLCDQPATWTPSPSVACRVRRVEVVRGKWEKPERPTYLDTRELGEGMSMDEFRAKRAAVWEEKRKQDVMDLKKGFG